MEQIRLMSHNQWRCDENEPEWEAKGNDCSAKTRQKGFARVFAELDPDIVGMQEVSPLMLAELAENLSARDKNYAFLWGADTPIAYKPDKFELVNSFFAYHAANIPGLDGEFNNDKTKSYTVAVFRTKADGKHFVFASTHLWWMEDDPESLYFQAGSDRAREYQINRVLDCVEAFAKQYNCPAVVVGDFNAVCNSPALKSAFARGFQHGHDIAIEYTDETNGCHYCFADGFEAYFPENFSKSIDHILFKYIPENSVLRFDRYYPDYYMPLSDHFPVFTDIKL